MKIARMALLVLLASSLAGLGVPAIFGQSTKNSRKKTAQSKRVSARSSQADVATTKKPPAGTSLKGRNTASTTAKKSSAKASGKISTSGAKKASGKSSRTKNTRKQPGQKAPTADRVSEIQAALAKNGSLQGAPSGKWDDNTTAAVRHFQSSHGLNPSGKLDAPTLQRLGLGSETAGVAAPTPPPGATSRLTSSANVSAGPIE